MIHVKGTYCLIIRSDGSEIDVGRLGRRVFQKGFYVYVGSGFGSLEGRIRRHLKKEKRLRWHIDYLLREAVVERILYTTDERRLECTISEKIHGPSSVTGFGCSDCRCSSHLHYFKTLDDATGAVLEAMEGSGARVSEWNL